MKIIVCVGIVPDIEQLGGDDYASLSQINEELQFTRRVWNYNDDNALELALHIRDAHTEAELIALCVGGSDCDPLLKSLYALRFDRVVRMESSDAWSALGDFIKNECPDLVITGKVGVLGGTGLTCRYIAKCLSCDCVTDAVQTDIEGRTATVQCIRADGEYVYQADIPLVLSASDTPLLSLRVPSLRDKLQYGKREVEVVSHTGKCEALKLISVTPVLQQRQCTVYENPSAAFAADMILNSISESNHYQKATQAEDESNHKIVDIYGGYFKVEYELLDRSLDNTAYHTALTSHKKMDINVLENADILLIAGYGLGSKDNADRMHALAKRLGAALGATRQTVLRGWLPMRSLVGASGAKVSPKLTVVFGASGAPAFYSGIEGSEKVIAVNSDKTAPMMKKSDIGFIADCNTVIDELMNRIK